jgi:Zn-dependent peptidase ImmA (M78 family)/transcriptional regulator with XRE-family HTH domain
MTLSERLKYARRKAGITLREIEERTGIGQSSLSEYEAGKRPPRLTQLQALAEVYRRSFAFFLAEGEPAPEVVLWRKRPDDAVAGDVEAKFLRLCEQYHNLEVWCVERRPCELPVASGNAADFNYREAEKLAYEVRAKLKLGDRPGRSLLPVLEEVCGVKLFHLSFEPSGTAASTVSETFGSAVLLNANNVQWRRNFDLAHELFHLLTWNVFRAPVNGGAIVASEAEEKLATCFASNLLMPVDATRLAVNNVMKDGKISFDDLFTIAREFDVSGEALLWRLHYLYHNREEDSQTRSDIERFNDFVRASEDREKDEPPIRPARFAALAVKALRQGQLSQGRFAEYMGITRREAMRIAEQEAPANEEVAIPSA